MTQLEICNKALRILGVSKVAQADLDGDLTEQARIINDIYLQNQEFPQEVSLVMGKD